MNTLLIVYLLLINIAAFALFGADKRKAKRNAWRISEKALFLSAVLGGSLGALIGMRRTRKLREVRGAHHGGSRRRQHHGQDVVHGGAACKRHAARVPGICKGTVDRRAAGRGKEACRYRIAVTTIL